MLTVCSCKYIYLLVPYIMYIISSVNETEIAILLDHEYWDYDVTDSFLIWMYCNQSLPGIVIFFIYAHVTSCVSKPVFFKLFSNVQYKDSSHQHFGICATENNPLIHKLFCGWRNIWVQHKLNSVDSTCGIMLITTHKLFWVTVRHL